jgi:DNA primase
MDFADQLKSAINIVNVIGEHVRLRKASRDSYKGLCPFHNEKTPSFNVSETKQFYYCFGCQASGDALKFVMQIEGLSFYEALKSLSERYGIPMPKRSQYADDDSRLRGAILQMHELAQEQFRANLNSPAGEAARAYLAKRGVKPETIEQFGLGYSLPGGRALVRLFEERGFSADQVEQSGLCGKRQDGSGYYDRFRNRLMFPIHNEQGKVIAFGGRALAADDEPKYLNSPETPLYKKKYVLYNLHRAKEPIRREDRAILVEGYMDAIGVTAAGIGSVVASCGTSLTSQQVQAIRRHSQRIVVNFDPDGAGANATERSIAMLLEEGMQVRIMELDGALDPDEYCKERGPDAYRDRLDKAKDYFYWLADGARKKYDVHTSEGVVAVLNSVLPPLQRISDRLARMAIANDLAAYIGVERGVVLDNFRKAIADRREKSIERPKSMIRADEKGLVNVLLSDAEGREELIAEIEQLEVIDRLHTRRILRSAMAIHAAGGRLAFDEVSARLEEEDRRILAEIAFAEESEIHEMTLEYGRQCLDSLRRTDAQRRRSQLKAKINESERAGNWEEAMRLVRELQLLERPDSRPPR